MTGPVVRGSIRRRLLVLLFCASAGMAVLLYFVVQSVARQVAQQSQDNVLAASALSVIDSARSIDGAITVDLPYAALSMLDSVADERVFYAVRLGQEVLTGYPDLPRPELEGRRQTAHLSADFLGEEVRIAAVGRPVSTDLGREVLEVSVAQTLAGQRATLAWSSRLALGIGAGFFALSVLLALLVARATVKPLDRLTQSVSRRGPTDLRPVASPVPQEMAPLVASLNGFMARLSASLDRSEDFIAEAAHRVRTPLALVRTKAEIIQRNVTKPENKDAIREMIRAIDESSRTAGQLLDHAMVSFRLDTLARDAVDLRALVTDTVERLQPVSEIKDIRLVVTEAQPATVRGDAILLQNAIRNLLDNAIKYSPAGTCVDVALTTAADEIRLDVRDSGPGFPDADSTALVQRFARGENAAGIIGSGLGLTIAQDVVAAHGGRLELTNIPGGGACASLLFRLS
ncbi:sensor histidine kinase N-terminal domain-containing protein [Sulfitobacter sp. D35]|uniref:sensor histidine kinase n=1 Tax=Sulfitobacter sp. D35 TaxID=3083252 RepID=UPI00296FE628|nr:sensor histidine kinase N-terminal domain-containing protein [Sulfitobacter sp. D35]MDW4496673.1 sensor histidine kinase N-terminal domain-containing protein [Sulfitobacter sp. D35]